ncbi:cytochrome ubiquinol oxidase subunit I [Allorhizocola rhizosphaerae]|uniref:cytochrome ubiquinol oxidase subunit I n=1 Tax=Allorhizocola rhizosphaerae TaxID=1872709 RepID=UPI000E3BEEE6|nr:cytochrome ubiquinol oxidase subunit I [Allorhizocola rhizosphaerae]
MSVLDIARLQFATTTIIHFLFVLVTLGLVTLLVAMQTAWAVTGRDKWLRHTRFWGRLYVINYFLGIATGVVLELQFGLNWAGLSHRLGNVFGTPLVIETLVAFMLESTFLGLWIFGFGRLPKWLHTALIWLVALTAYVSVFWIMAANSFLQNPVGYEQGPDGVIRLADLGALVTNPTFVMALPHVVTGAIMTGGFILAGISSWQLLRRTTDRAFFRTSLRLGVVVAFVGSLFTMGFGYAQFAFVTSVQPTKFGDDAAREAAVAQFTERFGPGDYDPPAYAAVSLGFMILIGTALFLVGLFMPLFFKDLIIRLRVPLVLLLLALPLPFVAAILGWLTREGGRQPFAAYGLLPLDEAITPGLSAGPMMTGYVAFTGILAVLALTNWALIARAAHRGAPLAPDTAIPSAAGTVTHIAAPAHRVGAGGRVATVERDSPASARRNGSAHTTFAQNGEGLTWLSY